MKLPDDLQAELERILAEAFTLKDDQGQPVQFSLKPGQHQYLYWAGPDGKLYCYTPHPDTQGRFWCWTYLPIGKGARTGQATRWRMIQVARFARRNVARNRAYQRFQKAQAEAAPPGAAVAEVPPEIQP